MATSELPPDMQATVLKLAEEPRRFLTLAIRLRDLREFDPSAFQSVIDVKPLQPRRSYELVRIAETFANKGISAERLEAIGWTKLAILARHLAATDGEHAPLEAFIDLAERTTVHHLIAQLKTLSDASHNRVVVLRFNHDHYEVFRAIMLANGAKKAKNGKGLVGQEAALMKYIDGTGSYKQ